MQARQHTMSWGKMALAGSALLLVPAILLGTRPAPRAQAAGRPAAMIVSSDVAVGTHSSFVVGTAQWHIERTAIYLGQFLSLYMHAHKITGDYSPHLEPIEMPTVEGARQTRLISYEFAGEPERTFYVPAVVTVHNGKLYIVQAGAPYTSDGSNPYRSQKTQNKTIRIHRTHP